MKFRCEHVFDNISVADYEQLYFDEEFNVGLCKALELGRDVKKREVTNGRLLRVVKVTPNREVPAAAQKILGSSKIEYIEHLDYVMGSNKGTWRSESGIMTDKIDSAGSFGWEKRGSGVMRYVDGEVKVKIFGVGGVIERFIVADVEKSYEKAAEFTRQWLGKKK